MPFFYVEKQILEKKDQNIVSTLDFQLKHLFQLVQNEFSKNIQESL